MYKRQLKNEEIAHICRSISLLIHAGMTQNDGLFLMAEEESDKFLKTMFLEMGEKIDQGKSLALAMEEQACFPVYVSGMVKAGEETGHPEEALEALAEYYDGQARIGKQIKNALTYPSFLLLLMSVVIGILLIKVMPIFQEVYSSLGSSLTGFAGGLLFLGEKLKSALPFLGLILLLAVGGLLIFSENEKFRTWILGWYRRHFANKGIAKKINQAYFAQALAMGIKSGMVVERSVELAGELVKDIPQAAENCRRCIEAIENGKSMGDSLKESDMMPASACRMLELGIRGGNGDQVMDGIAKRLLEDAENSIAEAVAKIEPVMVTITSLFVGMILLAVMLPLMNIMSAIG